MKTAPRSRTIILSLALLLAHVLSCKTETVRRTGLDHPNLRRFDDHQINQVIITAWDNFSRNNYEAAALDFERLLHKSYVDDDILFGAGISWYRHSNAKKALAYSTGALEKNPGHFEALMLRAAVYQGLGRMELARKDLEKIAGMNFEKPLVCGYYFDENDIAGRVKFDARKAQAKKMLGGE